MEIKKLIQILNHLSKPEILDLRKEIERLGGFDNSLNNFNKEI